MKTHLLLTAFTYLALSFLCGCASPAKRDLSVLQGNWVGSEIDGPPGECSMAISSNSLKFQGAHPEEWYKARLNLIPGSVPKQADIVIEDCSATKYVGKTAKAIYKTEGRTVTIAANEPGIDAFPAGFERSQASRARIFVFNKK